MQKAPRVGILLLQRSGATNWNQPAVQLQVWKLKQTWDTNFCKTFSVQWELNLQPKPVFRFKKNINKIFSRVCLSPEICFFLIIIDSKKIIDVADKGKQKYWHESDVRYVKNSQITLNACHHKGKGNIIYSTVNKPVQSALVCISVSSRKPAKPGPSAARCVFLLKHVKSFKDSEEHERAS